jgi:hypothetical protein
MRDLHLTVHRPGPASVATSVCTSSLRRGAFGIGGTSAAGLAASAPTTGLSAVFSAGAQPESDRGGVATTACAPPLRESAKRDKTQVQCRFATFLLPRTQAGCCAPPRGHGKRVEINKLQLDPGTHRSRRRAHFSMLSGYRRRVKWDRLGGRGLLRHWRRR